MSTAPIYNGGGATITLGSSGTTFDIDLESITPPGFAYNMIEATALGNTTCKTYVRGTTKDITPCTLKVIMDPAKVYTSSYNANEVITITVGGKSIAFQGTVTEFTPSEIVVNGKTTATIKISPTNLSGTTPTAPAVT